MELKKLEVSIVMEVPQYLDSFLLMENPKRTWMIWGLPPFQGFSMSGDKNQFHPLDV